MEVKKGFKQTDIGVMPSDWYPAKISSVSTLINGRGFKPYEWKTEGLPIIRIQNLNGSEEFNYYEGAYNPKIEVERGQLLFAWSGSRGTSFGPHIWNGEKGLLNYHTWKVVVNRGKIEEDYYFHALKKLTRTIEDAAHGASALVHTQKWEMEGFDIPLPPTKAEQTAIATALSDTDALIQSLEKLIAKKRAIKQGAMQELLTGKRRLPGFEGKWEEKMLAEVGCCIRGVSYKPESDLFSSDTKNSVRLFRSNNIQQNTIDFQNIHYVNATRVKALQIMQDGDILICMANGSKQLVGKAARFIKANNKYTFGAFMGCFRVDSLKAVPQFVFYNFQTYNYRSYIDVLLSGSSINNLRPANIESICIRFPCMKEQAAIASILTDMDSEIAALESKLAKYRTIKQGMMQELLTGKTRLV